MQNQNDMAVTTSLPGYLVKLQETSHQVHIIELYHCQHKFFVLFFVLKNRKLMETTGPH